MSSERPVRRLAGSRTHCIQGMDVAVRLERFGDRNHGVADVVTLLAVVCLALATWSCLANGASVPLWKAFASIALAGLLGHAALTRQPHWPTLMRFLTAAWMIAAPYLLGFADIPSALRANMAIGAMLMATASIPGAFGSQTSRFRLPSCRKRDFTLPARKRARQ
jgi:hypothetical protein